MWMAADYHCRAVDAKRPHRLESTPVDWRRFQSKLIAGAILLGLLAACGPSAAADSLVFRKQMVRVIIIDAALNRLTNEATYGQPDPEDLLEARKFLASRYSDAVRMHATGVQLMNFDRAYLELALELAEQHQLKLYPWLDAAHGYARDGDTDSGQSPADEVIQWRKQYSSPALGGLSTTDEPPLDRIAHLAVYHAALRQHWPEAIPVPILVGFDRATRYIEECNPRILVYDCYPLYQASLVSRVSESPPGDVSVAWDTGDIWELYDQLRAQMGPERPIWPVIQAFGYHPGQDETYNWRIPLPAEVKLQAYGLTALGAEGIWYFVYAPGSPPNDWLALVETPGKLTHLGHAVSDINERLARVAPILERVQPMPAEERARRIQVGRPHVAGVFTDPDDPQRLIIAAVNGIMLAEQRLSIRYFAEDRKLQNVAALDSDDAQLSAIQNELGWVTIATPNVGPGELILLEMRMIPPPD